MPAPAAQRGGDGRRRAVDLRAVEPARDRVDGKAAGRVEAGARHGDAGVITEDWVAIRDLDIDGVRAVLWREIEIMVEELAPGVHHPRKVFQHREGRVTFADDEVRNG